MPGPRNKQKSKAKPSTKENKNDVQPASSSSTTTPIVTARSAARKEVPPTQCLTLDEDGVVRCGQPATEGYLKPNRCKVHHGQYRILYKKYKDASEVVDKVKNGAELPTQKQIGGYTDWRLALEKARWVQKYLEAIRVEKTGREIHQKRFFLKVDDGHRRRLKLLEREMVKAVEVLDAVQRKAYDLYQPDVTLHEMNTPAMSAAEVELEKQSKRTPEELLESIRNPGSLRNSLLPVPKRVLSASSTQEDEDLISLSMREDKERMILTLKPLFDLESFINLRCEMAGCSLEDLTKFKPMIEMQFFIYQQFARRIIFHQPALFVKSLEKVSFKDLILSDDFSVVDLVEFFGLFLRPLEFPLRWFKDAALDALAITRRGTAANLGSKDYRFPLLGGWVFNRAHTASMTNEAWWHVLRLLDPPGNVENRFVRLCNNFDDLVGFLSFGALGLVPSPDFCSSDFEPEDLEGSNISRGHLSLSGIIVADMVGAYRPPPKRGLMPTKRRGTKRNCIVWAEVESRAYMFGAIRNERDPFVDAFLRELRARPDLFQVVLHSETRAPHGGTEMFGSGPSNDEALPAMRVRQFEAPPSLFPPSAPASSSSSSTSGGDWEVIRSAGDVLYGKGDKPGTMPGYLTDLKRNPKGWFFRFKTFDVTYFVILDAVPYRDHSVLARNVSWAALRAGGYAEGAYTLRKYAVASDELFDRCSKERLGWMPKEMEWKVTKMVDQLGQHRCKQRVEEMLATFYSENSSSFGS